MNIPKGLFVLDGRFIRGVLSAGLLAACQSSSTGASAPSLMTSVNQEGYPSSRATSVNTPDPISTDLLTGEIIDRRSLYATPATTEAVFAKPIAIQGYKSAEHFVITTKPTSGEPGTVQPYFVQVPNSLLAYRIGDTNGSVRITGISEPYVSWVQYCYPACDFSKPGLHVAAFPDGADHLVPTDPSTDVTSSRVSWPWVAYLVSNSTVTANLIVVNMETGRSRTISKATVIDNNSRFFYAINDGQIAWVETNGNSNSWTLSVMDLASGQTTLIPDRALDATGLSVSAQLVTWWSDHWRGYDREAGQSFTIPLLGDSLISDWKTIREVDQPTVHGRTITWSVELNGQLIGYSAVVAPRSP